MLFKALHGSSQRLDRPGIVFPTKDAPEFPVHESARSKARHHERPECKGPGTRVKCFQINFCQQRPRHRKTLGKLSRCRAACAIRSTSGSHLDPYRLNKAFEWNAMLLFWFNDRWGVSCHKKHKRTQKMQWRNINELCDSRIPSAGLAITKDHLPGAPLESRL